MNTARDIDFSPFEYAAANGQHIRGSFHRAGVANVPCVVFCHGFTGSRLGPGYLFVKISRALAEAGVASVRFDFRGSGESEGRFSDMNTQTMMADLDQIIVETRRTLEPARLILCGHSFGGMVAARRAASANADGIILLSPVGDPRGMIRRRKELLSAGPNSAGFYENGPHEMSLSFLDGLANIDPVEELAAGFRGKLLLLQGDKDLSITVDESYRYVEKALAAGIPADYRLLEGADHNYSRVAEVTAVTSTVIAWVKEHFCD